MRWAVGGEGFGGGEAVGIAAALVGERGGVAPGLMSDLAVNGESGEGDGLLQVALGVRQAGESMAANTAVAVKAAASV